MRSINKDYSKVIEAFEEAFYMEPGDIIGSSRVHEIVLPRHLCAYALVNYFGLSVNHTGRVLGKSHSTIVNSLFMGNRYLNGEQPSISYPTEDIKKGYAKAMELAIKAVEVPAARVTMEQIQKMYDFLKIGKVAV